MGYSLHVDLTLIIDADYIKIKLVKIRREIENGVSLSG